ncbi:MAG: hypothetical protein ACK4WB_10375, partial [Desulfatiglandales bacterium]
PLGKGPGEDKEELELGIEAASLLVPYVRLVERERLRLPQRSQSAIEALHKDPDTQRLIKESILDKLQEAKLSLLLKRGPASAQDLATSSKLEVGAALKHLGEMVKRGIAQFHQESRKYSLA